MGKAYVDQHIVPQSYLKHFAERNRNNKDYHICVFGKTRKVKSNPYIRSIGDIGFVKKIYDVSTRDDPKYWEHYIDRNIESESGRVINEIISRVVLHNKLILQNQEKESIARFIAFQIMRVPPFFEKRLEEGKEKGKALWGFVEKHFSDRIIHAQKDILSQYLLQSNGVKDILLESITDDERLKKYANILCLKTWIIIYNNSDMPFFTSDNPVLLQNIHDNSIGFGNAGIGRPDTLIFFPISSRIMIEIVPNRLLQQEQVTDGRVTINNDDYKFILMVNQLQYQNATNEIYFAPWFENSFKFFHELMSEQ